jgi:hypothetical protein
MAGLPPDAKEERAYRNHMARSAAGAVGVSATMERQFAPGGHSVPIRG